MDILAHLSPLWREHIERFLDSRLERSGSEKGAKAYRDHLKVFFAQHPGKTPADITRADCAAFLTLPSQGRRNYGQPISAGTRNNRLTVLRSLYAYLSEQEITLPDGSTAPLYDKPLPTRGLRYGKGAKPYRSMDHGEVTAFFQAIDTSSVKGKRDYAIMWFAFLTCRRREELSRLRWQDISETVFVENGVARQGFSMRYIGKGHAREVRVQELPGSCYRALIDYLSAAGRLDTIRPEDPLFTNVRHSCGHTGYGEKLCGHWLNTIFREIAAKANLPIERLSLHSLRHAGARARAESGSTLEQISRVLDHSAPEITLRYLQTQSTAADPGAAALEKRFSFLSR